MSNYTRGYYTEQKIMKEFREKGIWATRSPASKGLFDVTAVDRKGVYLIQSKRTKRKTIPPSLYRDEIQKIQEWIGSLPHPLPKWLYVQFWIWQDRKGWTKLEITKSKVEVLDGDFETAKEF